MTKRVMYSFSLILLGTASMYAGDLIKAEVPFPFPVGNSKLSAGSYTADMNVAQGVLRVRSADCKSTVLILSSAVQSSTEAAHAKLVFTKYGDEYFLSQVWPAGTGIGRELTKSRSEREIAAATPRATGTVLARR